jgi:TonB family protein
MSKRKFRFQLFCLVLSQTIFASTSMELAARAQTAPGNGGNQTQTKPVMRPVAAAKAALNPMNAAKNAKKALSPVNNAAKAAKEKLTKTLAPEPQTQAIRDKWAFLVGLEAFNDDNVRPVKNAQQNAVLISSFLASPDLGKFGPARVVVVTNNKATKNNVSKALGDTWLLKNALPNDLIVLYFCTRGEWKADGSDLNLYMFDTPSSQPELACVSLKETLSNLQRRTQSKNILCLLDLAPVIKQKEPGEPADDATPGGAAGSSATGMTLEKIAQESGTTILAANSVGGKSYQSSTKGCSSFVEQLLEGLATSKGEIEFEQVADYVCKMVKEKVAQDFRKEQTPVFATSEVGAPMLKTIVSCAVKSSTPEKHAKFGHPPERAPEERPRPSQAVSSQPTPKAASAKTTSSKTSSKASTKEDDDEEEIDYSQTGNVDFGPYMDKMKKDIQSKWKAPKGFNAQRVVAVFSIKKDGTIANASIVDGSGVESVDKSAMEALNAASPLDPLPPGSPPYVQIRYQFDWTVTKN